MLVHEWQLGPKMNESLQQKRPADFRLWRAFLSQAVEEQAAFVLEVTSPEIPQPSWHQRFGIKAARPYQWQEGDEQCLAWCGQALQSGWAQSRLQQQLAPAPWVLCDDAKKLAPRVADNLDLHSRRRWQQQSGEPVEADATVLYEVLQQLRTQAA